MGYISNIYGIYMGHIWDILKQMITKSRRQGKGMPAKDRKKKPGLLKANRATIFHRIEYILRTS